MEDLKSKIKLIPQNLLHFISGGSEETPNPNPSPTPVTIIGGGNTNGIGGTVIGNITITPNTTLVPYVNINSIDGVNGGGAKIIYNW